MLVEIRHQGKTLFCAEGDHLPTILSQAGEKGIDLAPSNIDEDGTQSWGCTRPRGRITVLVRITVKQHQDKI